MQLEYQMNLHDNKETFAQAIRATAQELGIAPEFIEKDYWICRILQRLSSNPLNERIVWKGGTSLSKAYGLIKRFSSDVDFAVLLEGLSQNQQKKLVSKIGKETTADLEEFDVPEGTIKNNKFRKTFHRYESVLGERKRNLNFLGNYVIVEINTYGNPYPYLKKRIKPFITEMLERRRLYSLINELEVEPFELNVLDKRQTLCEKIVSLLRFSFEDNVTAGIASKIRHFYDIYYLTQDKDCIEYLNSGFSNDLLQLIAHDKAEFDRPPKWKNTDIMESPLLSDFDSIWMKVSPIYKTEVGALSYGSIPAPNDIHNTTTHLLELVKTIIKQKQ